MKALFFKTYASITLNLKFYSQSFFLKTLVLRSLLLQSRET